jgi:hypothetical protein
VKNLKEKKKKKRENKDSQLTNTAKKITSSLSLWY